jgi:ankyrin repeat protein
LDKGAEPGPKDETGQTPLHRAAEYGYEAVAKLLLEKGLELGLENKDGETPLH